MCLDPIGTTRGGVPLANSTPTRVNAIFARA